MNEFPHEHERTVMLTLWIFGRSKNIHAFVTVSDRVAAVGELMRGKHCHHDRYLRGTNFLGILLCNAAAVMKESRLDQGNGTISPPDVTPERTDKR